MANISRALHFGSKWSYQAQKHVRFSTWWYPICRGCKAAIYTISLVKVSSKNTYRFSKGLQRWHSCITHTDNDDGTGNPPNPSPRVPASPLTAPVEEGAFGLKKTLLAMSYFEPACTVCHCLTCRAAATPPLTPLFSSSSPSQTLTAPGAKGILRKRAEPSVAMTATAVYKGELFARVPANVAAVFGRSSVEVRRYAQDFHLVWLGHLAMEG